VLAIACYLIGGFPGLLWGFAISTTLLWHGTYSINSLAHLWGTRRYETTDTSRNNLLLALLTFGEGWHNNHHYFMASVRQGFFWYEIDITYYILRAFAAVGLVWDLKLPTKEIREGNALRVKQAA
jgi:stearoyl-CoA desaturase (delta-9 desaturase)